MERRTFFKKLAVGVAAAPAVVAAAKEAPAEKVAATRPGFRRIPLPADSGKVLSAICYQDRLFVACENGLYYSEDQNPLRFEA